ncbi:ARPP-1 family domain-containing protein [Methanobacterium aggregans]|uniref:ARPP-1 family domain-containing protein n=1 Tax=Methanobacterium aggregans TaxID=1615586 RepID=UPI001AE7187B|nr:DUF6569 family protein [Methanobacterium aggregans]MBP2045267.1 hypothetical protein [Methanobacterium aggregans]
MNAIMVEYIDGMDLGETQVHGGMSVIPLFDGTEDSGYITLKEALDLESIVITELDEHGAVPELKVHNLGDVPVLLLDGEELVGAKQNRVLNTTILLKEGSETVIPVSCTEHGRWSYTSDRFADSGHVAANRVRRSKNASVCQSLRNHEGYRSNQMEVWDEISELSHEAMVMSETGAMRDVYSSREKDMEEYMEAFPLMDDQKGVMVLIKGEVAGMDRVSSSAAYKLLHEKLVKSYAIEALLDEEDNSEENISEAVDNFLEDLKSSLEETHKSVGYGYDHRFESPGTLGSALIHEDRVLHAAFFNKNEKKPGMSGYRERRSFRDVR